MRSFIKKGSSYLTLLVILFTSLSANAKEGSTSDAVFHKGTKVVSAALGISIDDFANQIKPHLIPILMYDQGFFDNVGIGNIGIGAMTTCKFLQHKYTWGDYKQYSNAFYIALRGTYHFTKLNINDSRFDPYAGLMLGVKVAHTGDTWLQYKQSKIGVAKGIFVGARYILDDRFSAFSELGYNISFVSIGIQLNL